MNATLLGIMMLAAPWCLLVPLPALAGVLLFVAWNMGEWRDFARVWAHHPWERWMMLLTFGLTVVTDLGIALSTGIGLAVLRALWAQRAIRTAKTAAAAGNTRAQGTNPQQEQASEVRPGGPH